MRRKRLELWSPEHNMRNRRDVHILPQRRLRPRKLQNVLIAARNLHQQTAWLQNLVLCPHARFFLLSTYQRLHLLDALRFTNPTTQRPTRTPTSSVIRQGQPVTKEIRRDRVVELWSPEEMEMHLGENEIDTILSGKMEYGKWNTEKLIEHRACVDVHPLMLVLSSMEFKYLRKLVLIKTSVKGSAVVPKSTTSSPQPYVLIVDSSTKSFQSRAAEHFNSIIFVT